MDVVERLNNILVIGMTNRIDMIDEALLRPGRLEVHMEISIPDENGRLQILAIHTATMKKNGVMDSDVDLNEIATRTKNFTGAEIGGLIKNATSFAFNRHVKVKFSKRSIHWLTEKAGRDYGRHLGRCRSTPSESWGLHERPRRSTSCIRCLRRRIRTSHSKWNHSI